MSAPRDLDRQLESFLTKGPMDLPEPSYARVRDRIERKRQQADLGLWRTSRMNRYLQYGLAAAVVVVIAVVAINRLPGSPGPGKEPSATPEASEAPPSVEPSSSADAALPVGAYLMDIFYGGNLDQVTLTISAPGWFAGPEAWSVTKDPGGDDRVMVAVAPHDSYMVPADSCNWRNGGAHVGYEPFDDFVAAFTAQTHNTAGGSLPRGYSTPEAVTIDGYSGVSITSTVPVDPNGDASGCYQQRFCSLVDRVGAGCLLSHLEPGALDTIWILEFGGGFQVLAASFRPTTGSELLAEMNAIVDSLHNIVIVELGKE